MTNRDKNILIAQAIGEHSVSSNYIEGLFSFDSPLPLSKDGQFQMIGSIYKFNGGQLQFDSNWMWFMYAFEKLKDIHNKAEYKKEVRLWYGSCEVWVVVGTKSISTTDVSLNGLFQCLVSHYQSLEVKRYGTH